MSLPLDPGYTVRAPRPDDAEAVQALTAISDLHEFGEAEGYTIEEIRDEWDALDLDRDAWLVISPDGSLAGYAYLHDRRHVRIDVEGYVHPEHYGHGVGTTIVRLSEARAREHIPLAPDNTRVVVHNWISGTNERASALLEREGYSPVRYFMRMETALDGSPPPPQWPEGVTVRTFKPGDERLFYEVAEAAFADHWGHIPVDFDTWKQRRFGNTFDPTLWFLATAGDEPAGLSLCSIAHGIGWVDYLGVLRPWRKRGLGMALLRHSFGEFQKRGLNRAALGVDTDSPTGATRLYERAGMQTAQQHATYGKELRPGEDLTDDDDGERE